MSDDRTIHVGHTADGTALSVPVVELLTGRGFVTGKSGSGKSNTASVIAEELLEAGFPLLIVDTDGEYYGLKEEYEMLHAGADEECDIQIGPEHAEQMATLALEENVPIILDVSGYLEEGRADELLRETARQLFVKEKKLKKPFLLVVEEVHEYIPEGGGVGETGNLLIKIGKRGRKHGLGILGISQRPADVKKDFITQANWLVWHRLTWDNDTKVVGRIIDSQYSELVADLDDGQAFVQADWTDAGVRKVQFRRKRTFDAGATPGLEDFERPDLKSVSDSLVGDLEAISDHEERERNRIQELEAELDKRDQRIATLEAELSTAKDVSQAAQQMADALTQHPRQRGDDGETSRRLHQELAEAEREVEQLRDRLADRESRIDELEAELARATTEPASDRGAHDAPPMADTDEPERPVLAGGDSVASGGPPTDSETTLADVVSTDADRGVQARLDAAGVADRVTAASGRSQCTTETAASVIALVAEAGQLPMASIASEVDRSRVAVQGLCSELVSESVLERRQTDRYALTPTVRSALLAGGDR